MRATVSELKVLCCETRLYLIPLALQRLFGCSDERSESGDEEDGSKVSERGKRMETA